MEKVRQMRICLAGRDWFRYLLKVLLLWLVEKSKTKSDQDELGVNCLVTAELGSNPAPVQVVKICLCD